MSRTQFPNKVPQPMPGQVKGALAKRNLLDTYIARPQYQKDDYLKWVAAAAGPTEKQKRIDQLVDEIEKGNVFKGEPWTAPEPVAPAKSADGGSPAPAAKPSTAKPAAKAPAPTAKPAAKPAAKAPAAKPTAKKK